MQVTIHPLTLGPGSGCYILQGQKTMLIDCGGPGQIQAFTKALRRLSIQPQDIELILLTHTHWDHMGSAKEIQDLTGAPLALHYREKEAFEKVTLPVPAGVTRWGRIMAWLLAKLMPSVHIAPGHTDILLGDDGLSLIGYGIPGRVVYTPGHSIGSVSVLLDTGEAFVGDLAMSGLPLRLGPGLPILAEDLQQVKASWRKLIAAGAQTIYPAHGKPFSVEAIRQVL